MNKTILALDLGAKTGYSLWVLINTPSTITPRYVMISSGVIDVAKPNYSWVNHCRHFNLISAQESHNAGVRYLSLIESLKWALIDLGDYKNGSTNIAIFYEKVHNHVGVYAAHKYGAYEACIDIFSALYKSLPPIGIPVGVWKKDIIGKGNANKAEIRDTVVDLIWTDKLTFPNFDTNKLEKITYDECDAIAIGLHACKQQKD